MSMGSSDDIELEKKVIILAEYLIRDLNEIGLGHLSCNFHVEPSENGPIVTISHNGTDEDGELVSALFNTLLKEQEWPGI